MQPPETLGYWLNQTMRSVANAFSELLQTSCATLGKSYALTPQQWFALGLLANHQDLPIGTLAQQLALDASVVTGCSNYRSTAQPEATSPRANGEVGRYQAVDVVA